MEAAQHNQAYSSKILPRKLACHRAPYRDAASIWHLNTWHSDQDISSGDFLKFFKGFSDIYSEFITKLRRVS